MLRRFSYVKVASLNEAVKELGSKDSVLHAGGTDLLGCMRENIFPAERVVSISGLAELNGIAVTAEGGLRIGALTTIAEIAADNNVREKYGALAQAAVEVASPQLRNQGTIGGNLCQRPRCWYFRGDFHCAKKGGDLCYAEDGENQFHAIFGGDPCYAVHPSDTAVALTALRANLRVAGPGGSRTVKIEEFFIKPDEDIERENVLAPNEVITEVVLPPVGNGMRSSYRKVRDRRAWDFALTSVALALEMEGDKVGKARIVLGGVAPLPWRVQGAEQAIIGKAIDEATAGAAAEAAAEGAKPLSGNAYKVNLVKGAIIESLLAPAG